MTASTTTRPPPGAESRMSDGIKYLEQARRHAARRDFEEAALACSNAASLYSEAGHRFLKAGSVGRYEQALARANDAEELYHRYLSKVR